MSCVVNLVKICLPKNQLDSSFAEKDNAENCAKLGTLPENFDKLQKTGDTKGKDLRAERSESNSQ